MKYLKVFMFGIFLIASGISNAVTHTNKSISKLQISSVDGCVYFKLDGVDLADPVRDGSGWFTLSSDNSSKSEIMSLLLSAYVAKLNVTVSTTGSMSNCSYAEVDVVLLE